MIILRMIAGQRQSTKKRRRQNRRPGLPIFRASKFLYRYIQDFYVLFRTVGIVDRAVCNALHRFHTLYHLVENGVLIVKPGRAAEERLPAEEADVLRRVQGDRLAQSALKLRRAAADLTDTPVLAAAERSFVWPCKKADPAVIPGETRVTGFQPDGERAQTVYALRLGALELIGVQPEFDAAASLSVSAQAGPERLRAAVCMVHGCGKCMPSLRAYDPCRFQADHSPFMPGAAERMVEVAGELKL